MIIGTEEVPCPVRDPGPRAVCDGHRAAMSCEEPADGLQDRRMGADRPFRRGTHQEVGLYQNMHSRGEEAADPSDEVCCLADSLLSLLLFIPRTADQGNRIFKI